MKRIMRSAALALLGLGSALSSAHAGVITAWQFTTGVTSPVPSTVAATTGTGTGTALGMANGYTYTNGFGGATLGTGSVDGEDITSTTGTLDTGMTEFLWRIRGAKGTGTTGSGNNGWNLSAPQYSQGAEFDTSTAGFQNITFQFDWYSTTHGITDLQVQYNTNTGNSAGWTNLGSPFIATANDYFGGATPTPIVVTLPAGANNDSTFGVRLVSAYDPTYSGTGSPTYTDASGATGITGDPAPQVYNNNSGNWRFGNIIVSGTAVPEPSILGLAGVGVLTLARRRRIA